MRNGTVKYPALLGVAWKNFSEGKKLRCFEQRVRNGEKNFSCARFFLRDFKIYFLSDTP